MASIVELITSVSETATSSAGLFLLKSTPLALAGIAAAWILRRRRAAFQSAVLRVTLLAVVLCPLASIFLKSAGGPRIEVPAPWIATAAPAPPSALNSQGPSPGLAIPYATTEPGDVDAQAATHVAANRDPPIGGAVPEPEEPAAFCRPPSPCSGPR